jgi:hypothetical protein
MVEVISCDANNVTQLAYELFDANRTMLRHGGAGGWGAWKQQLPIDDANLPARLGSTALALGDWNVATTDGWYYSGSVPNAPIQGYWLIGIVATGQAGIIQTVWTRDYDQQWFRRYNGSTWGAWVSVYPVNFTALTGSISDTQLPLRLGSVGQQVPSNDCNNAINQGWYWSSPGAANAPGGSYYAYQVYNVTSPTQVRQIAYDYATDDIFMRRFTSPGPFTAWTKIWPISASGGGADLTYLGDYNAATAYKDGDIVVGSDGLTYMCVTPTTGTAPVAFPATASGIPLPVQNGKVIMGVGGAAVWASVEAVADTAWHTLGAAGEPAFMNGYANYGSPFGPVKFRKLATGLVVLDGLVQCPATAPGITPMFALPVGYRPHPLRTLIFSPASSYPSDDKVRIDGGSGQVYCQAPPASVWLSLSGVQFYAES